MNFEQVPLLEDARVQLRPFQASDTDTLCTIAFDETIWRYMVTRISNKKELDAWVGTVTKGYAQGTRYTFMIVDKAPQANWLAAPATATFRCPINAWR